MSGNVTVWFRGRMFWAKSYGLSIVIAATVEAADRRGDLAWLDETIESWRVQACVRDLGMTLDDDWSPEQVGVVASLVDEAGRWLAGRGSLPAAELNGWHLSDELTVDGGGFTQAVDVAGPVEVATAVRDLLLGTLPPDPDDGWWFVGKGTGRSTIRRRVQQQDR